MFHEHVKEYKLAFSDNDSNYQVYQENGKDRVSFVTAYVDTYLQDTPGIYDWRIGVSVTRKHLYGSKFRRLSVQKYIETTKSRRGQIFSRYGRSGVKTITV